MLTTIIGSLMGLSLLPQAWRVFKLKRSEEVSLFTFSFILFGACVWIIYGLTNKDWVIVIANICGVIGSGTVLLTSIYYRKYGSDHTD